tara:strand:- start:68 stop:295 length:228 start_codon:yes stop_codon:yes gene_type:complete
MKTNSKLTHDEDTEIMHEIIGGICDIDAPIHKVAELMTELGIMQLQKQGYTDTQITTAVQRILDYLKGAPGKTVH